MNITTLQNSVLIHFLFYYYTYKVMLQQISNFE